MSTFSQSCSFSTRFLHEAKKGKLLAKLFSTMDNKKALYIFFALLFVESKEFICMQKNYIYIFKKGFIFFYSMYFDFFSQLHIF